MNGKTKTEELLAEARQIIDEFVQCDNVGRFDGRLVSAAKDFLSFCDKPAQAPTEDASELVREVKYWLDNHPHAIRSYPGNGVESLAQSFALTIAKTEMLGEPKESPRDEQADAEVLSRDLCRRRGVDPESLTNVDGLGTMIPMWQAWKSCAVAEFKRLADRSRLSAASQAEESYRKGYVAAMADSIRNRQENA